MIAVLYLLTFVAGAAAGAAYAYWWVDHYTNESREKWRARSRDTTSAPARGSNPLSPTSRYTYLRTGYHDGYHDGALGIWRGGPLR